MTLWEKIKLVLAVIVGGIWLWADPPRKFQLRVDKDHEERRERERCESGLRAPLGPVYDPQPDHRPPPLKHIHLDCWDKRYRQWSPCVVAIDLKKRRLDLSRTSTYLIGKEYRGSGMIGVALFSLPVTLPLSPLLIVINKWYGSREKRVGMSRHGWAMLKSLKGQLDPETEALLVEALKNDWTFDRKMSRQVTAAEAAELLAGCDLREHVYPAEPGRGVCPEGGRDLHWFDDAGDHVAQMQYVGDQLHFARVLGTEFEAEEAAKLAGHCRTSRTEVRE